MLNKSEVEIMKHYTENINPKKVIHFMSAQKKLLQKMPFLFYPSCLGCMPQNIPMKYKNKIIRVLKKKEKILPHRL